MNASPRRRPLRIAHVSATFPPYHGGTGNVCYHNARVLAARGHEVRVYTAAWPGDPDDPPGVAVHRLRPLWRVGNAPVLPQLLRLRDVDLIHLHFPFYSGGDLVALGERLGGPPYVVTYHQDVELAGWLGRVATVHDRTLGRLVLRRAARLCPTSLDYLRHSAVADLGAAMGTRVVPLPNGVDLERFRVVPVDPEARRRFGLPPEGAVVLFVGAMDHAHHFKGVPTLLEALRRTPEASALLVGDGELRPDYERRAAALGIGGRVRFLGRVATDRLVDAYRASDVLVLPSVTRGEAFGMVLLEAMASGRPVIATDLPGVRSVVDHGRDGLLVPPGDAAALAAAIGEIAGMPAGQRAAMGAAGRAKVEREYGWERIGDRLEELYDAVLSEGSRATPVAGRSDEASPSLPIETRAAIDLVVERCRDGNGPPRGVAVGAPGLVAELRRYGWEDASDGPLVLLGATADEARAAVAAGPSTVVTVEAGPAARLLRPLRAGDGGPVGGLPGATWRAWGYEPAWTEGVQGPGSVGWAVAGRALRRVGRPDLADRCRLAMLRGLVASRTGRRMATILVRGYRRGAS